MKFKTQRQFWSLKIPVLLNIYFPKSNMREVLAGSCSALRENNKE